jgi:phosphatidate cytidylyltransferase
MLRSPNTRVATAVLAISNKLTMLRHRLQSAAIMIALTAGAFFLPPWGVLCVLLTFCAIGMGEYNAMLTKGNIAHFPFFGLVGGLGLVSVTFIEMYYTAAAPANEGGMLWLALWTMALFVRQFYVRADAKPLQRVAATIMGMLYVAFLLNFVTMLLMGWGVLEGRLLVLHMILTVKCSDIGAYFVGCKFGKHKLIPRISPAKTWEGCLGGVLSSVAVSVGFAVISGGDLGPVTLSIAHAIIMGILLGVIGVVGDLAESLLKRAAEIKDSGHLLKGMGGMLDVLDSLLFAAPVAYAYARFVLPPV